MLAALGGGGPLRLSRLAIGILLGSLRWVLLAFFLLNPAGPIFE